MNIILPDEIIQSAQMSADDIKLEIAIVLYHQHKISMGQACRLAGIPLIEFQRQLSRRGLCINYDIEDFQADLNTLREAGDL
jgi:predicted HTH domain antitoxin